MKTGIGTSAYFTLYDYKKGLATASKHGFDCLDFQCFNREENELYKLSEVQRQTLLKEIKNCADQNGIVFFQSHAPWWLVCDENKLPFYEAAIRGVAALGCEYMAVHPVTNFSVPDTSQKNMEKVHTYNLRYFEKLLPIAKECGVTLCVENLPDHVLGLHRVTHIKRLIEELNSPYIKACLDIGHAHIYSDNIEDDILLLGDDLKLLHVHDNTVYLHDEHLLPYQGTVLWDDFYSGLKKIRFDGVISLELATPYHLPGILFDEFHTYVAELAKFMAKQATAQ